MRTLPAAGGDVAEGWCGVAMAVAAVDRLSADVQGPVSHRRTPSRLWHLGAGVFTGGGVRGKF